MKRHLCTLALAAVLAIAFDANAQELLPAAALRGVPTGTPTSTPLVLTLADAVHRGLARNLTAVLEEQRLRHTQSARLAALSELLPHLSASMRQSDQVISTAAFGFTFPGVPTVIGPFRVFDARLSLSAPLFDARAIGGLRSGQALVRASQADLGDVRETIVLAVGNLYLEAEADAARVESARAQVATADALARLADDQRLAGIVAGIDVLRQQVQLQSARARLIAAENAFEKRKLLLGRAIGLPAGQAITLGDVTTFTPAPSMTIDDAVATAAANREDLKAARSRVEAARTARAAESAARLPTLHLDADVAALGTSASNVDRTYTIAAVVRVPVFEGGRTRARVQQADTEVQSREAELADIAGGLRYDVEAALLDVNAAAAAVAVAENARALSRQELDQAQDRFSAGVASTLELVQAQESVAASSEQYISSVYAHTVAKASLARALGQVEAKFLELVGGRHS